MDESAKPARTITANAIRVVSFLAALCVVSIICSAIPFRTVPTVIQAVWASGFAQSYANHGWLSIYATNFGLPQPAPIAFGLSATFIQGLLIRLTGISSIDAYTCTVVLYLALALYGAVNLARRLGASWWTALLLGILWLDLPIIWMHAGYSMLMLGLALLPWYVGTAEALLDSESPYPFWKRAALFVLASIVSVFMDGYSFVMFAAAAGVLWLARFVTDRSSRRKLLLLVAPAFAFGYLTSYFLYTSFVGTTEFERPPLGFFRAWGVDITMIFWPTRGVLWLWDALGIGAHRTDAQFWGDASVWLTSFLAPLLIVGIVGFAIAGEKRRTARWLAISLLGIYFALGPSLKIDSTKEVPHISASDRGPPMPAQYAIAPTGSAWIYQHVPGFENMRAPYRWLAISALGLWALVTLLVVRLHRRNIILAYAVVLLAMTAFVPHVVARLRAAAAFRSRVELIDTNLLADVMSVVKPKQRVFFAPYGNDFLAGYLAASGDFNAYNIGGDKNLRAALRTWSDPMRNLYRGRLTENDFLLNARQLLLDGEADILIFPFFDLTWSAQNWPPAQTHLATQRGLVMPVVQKVSSSDCLAFVERHFFAAIYLSDIGKRVVEREAAIDSSWTHHPVDTSSCTRTRSQSN